MSTVSVNDIPKPTRRGRKPSHDYTGILENVLKANKNIKDPENSPNAKAEVITPADLEKLGANPGTFKAGLVRTIRQDPDRYRLVATEVDGTIYVKPGDPTPRPINRKPKAEGEAATPTTAEDAVSEADVAAAEATA